MPNRQRLKVLLDDEFGAAQTDFFSDLGPDTKISLALDSWTSPGSQFGFFAIVAYYISTDWKYQQVLICFERLVGAHSGENLASVVEKVALQFKLTDRLYAVMADNASNNATLRRALEKKLGDRGISWRADAMAVNCLAHMLNLSAKALLLGLGFEQEDDGTSDEEGEDDAHSISSTDDMEEFPHEVIETVTKVQPSLIYDIAWLMLTLYRFAGLLF